MKSRTLSLYHKWLATATSKQTEFVDSVYAMCEANYSNGGDTIVECFTPAEIITEFKSLADAKSFCGLKVEQATNCRWGEDTDPELAQQKRFDTDWH